MRIRIKQKPPDGEFSGFTVSHLKVGEVYEVGPKLATLLIVSGYAEPEMRVRDRAADDSSIKKDDWS